MTGFGAAEAFLGLVLGLGLGFLMAWPTPLLNPSMDFLVPPADLRDPPTDRRDVVVLDRRPLVVVVVVVVDFRFDVDGDFARPRTLASLFPDLSLVLPLLAVPWLLSQFVEEDL